MPSTSGTNATRTGTDVPSASGKPTSFDAAAVTRYFPSAETSSGSWTQSGGRHVTPVPTVPDCALRSLLVRTNVRPGAKYEESGTLTTAQKSKAGRPSLQRPSLHWAFVLACRSRGRPPRRRRDRTHAARGSPRSWAPRRAAQPRWASTRTRSRARARRAPRARGGSLRGPLRCVRIRAGVDAGVERRAPRQVAIRVVEPRRDVAAGRQRSVPELGVSGQIRVSDARCNATTTSIV